MAHFILHIKTFGLWHFAYQPSNCSFFVTFSWWCNSSGTSCANMQYSEKVLGRYGKKKSLFWLRIPMFSFYVPYAKNSITIIIVWTCCQKNNKSCLFLLLYQVQQGQDWVLHSSQGWGLHFTQKTMQRCICSSQDLFQLRSHSTWYNQVFVVATIIQHVDSLVIPFSLCTWTDGRRQKRWWSVSLVTWIQKCHECLCPPVWQH